MSNSFGQETSSSQKNIGFFTENEPYMRAQERFELYQLMRLAVEREIAGAQRMLDVGNGGFFNYSTESIPEVVACDLMLENNQIGPNIVFKQGSILELPFDDNRFDCVLVQSTLHHVVGDSVHQNLANLNRAICECARVISPGGKLVVVESTIPAWFLYLVEYPLYSALVHVWPFSHPLTFQFTRQLVASEIEKASLRIIEYSLIPRGNWAIHFGLVLPTLITPIQVVKIVAEKQ